MPPPGLFTLDLLVAALVIVVAGFMRGFTGFGSAMVMVPLFSLIYGPVQAVATGMLLETAVTLQLLPGALPRTRWRVIGPMAAAACAALPLGAYLLVSVDAEIMRRAIAGVVLVFALIMARGWRYAGPRRPAITVGAGLLSGVMITSVGMGGPPVILYLLSGPDAAAQNRANLITYFAIGGGVALVVLLFGGVIGAETLWRAVVLALPFVAAAHAGSRFFRRSGEALYRRVALTFLMAIALATLLA